MKDENATIDQALEGSAIRPEIINCTMSQWTAVDTLDLSNVTPDEFRRVVGLCGFLTALVNPEEEAFIAALYRPNESTEPRHEK